MQAARTLGFLFSIVPAFAFAQVYVVNPAEAEFVVVTQKEGIASTLAHDHLVRAQEVNVTLNVPENNISKGSFRVSIPTKSLEIDNPEKQKSLFPTLKNLDIQKKEFTALGEKDRAKIKANMDDAGQMDVAKFPTLTAEVSEISESDSQVGSEKFTHQAKVKVTIKGKTVERPLPARITLEGGKLRVLSTGGFKFSEFGIKPYSALFGAIRNADPFTIFVSFEALPAGN
jgi:polyisoprenoid-binding protein YceI